MSRVESYNVPKAPCPHCGYRADGVFRANAGTGGPSPGDFVVCFGCTELLQFGEGMETVPADPAAVATLSKEYMQGVEESKELIKRLRCRIMEKTGGGN